MNGRLEPDPHPHRRQVGVGVRAGEVAGGEHEPPARLDDGEPEGVADGPLVHHLVVTHQAGEDRQAGGVGRGPPRRPQGVRIEVEDRPRARRPAPPARVGPRGEEFIEPAVVAVDDQDMPIPFPVRPPLDRRVGGDGVRAGVALVGVAELHGHPGLIAAHDDIGNPVGQRRGRPARSPGAAASRARPAPGSPPTGGRPARPRDVLVPGVIGREDRAAAEARARPVNRVVLQAGLAAVPQPAPPPDPPASAAMLREPAAAWNARSRDLLCALVSYMNSISPFSDHRSATVFPHAAARHRPRRARSRWPRRPTLDQPDSAGPGLRLYISRAVT